MSEEKQMTPLQTLLANLDSAIEGIKLGQKIEPGFAKDTLSAFEAVKKDAESLLPKEKQGIIDAVDNTKGYYTDREYVSSNVTGEEYFNSKYNQ